MTRFILAVSLCLFFASPAFAQTLAGLLPPAQPIGSIMEVEGAGTVIHQGKAGPAQINGQIYLGDTVETAEGSKLDVLFVDETEITLSEKAQLKIDEYVYDPANTATNKGRFSAMRGAFLFVSGLMDKIDSPDVRIATPYGAIGLRGTTVWGGGMDNAFGVFVQDGAVDVQNNGGVMRVGKGEGTNLINSRTAPTAAKQWSPERIARARKFITLRRAAAVRARVMQHKQQLAGLRRERVQQALRQRRQLQQQAAPQQQQPQARSGLLQQWRERRRAMRQGLPPQQPGAQ